MKQLAFLFLLSGSAALGQATAHHPAHPAHPAPPACRAITSDMVKRPLTLPEGCYTVNQFLNVEAPLTLSPGSSILFGGGTELAVESNGSFDAVGTADKPILLRSRNSTAGSWSGLSISSRSAHNRLSYVTLEDAGVEGRDNAAIVLAPGAQLGLDHTTIKGSLSSGIFVMDNASFSHFEANHFAHTDIPLRVKASDLAILDAATTFADNRNNVVVVPPGEGKVGEEALWHKLAVPYRFEAAIEIGAKVTIEAGTEMQFRENQPLYVVQNGSLTAIGTAAEPIIFTATDETPGYWAGILFESASSRNLLRHVDVRFGGSRGGAVRGGIGITHQASATVESSAISSAPVGIFVASEGTLNANASSSNHFQNVQQNIFVEP